MGGRYAVPRPVRVAFWEGVRAGLATKEAGWAAGVSHETARRWFGQAGGVIGNGPGPVGGRYLSLAEREEIAVGRAAGLGVRQIAAALGRAPSTVGRELARNSGERGYRATVAKRGPGSGRAALSWPSGRPVPGCASWCKTGWARGGHRSRSASC